MRIPLPEWKTEPGATSHAYPLRIAWQTAQFLQAAAFHAAIWDTAAGERIRQPNAIEELKRGYVNRGLDAATWDQGWSFLAEFLQVFESSVCQSVVTSLRSHWDWYVRRLGQFVTFARAHVACPELGAGDAKLLASVGKREFTEQLEILGRASSTELMPEKTTIEAVVLATHVRNLGLHNRWEVDEQYRASHPDCGLQVGDLRTVDTVELETWSSALRDVVRVTATAIGKRFVDAPAYPTT